MVACPRMAVFFFAEPRHLRHKDEPPAYSGIVELEVLPPGSESLCLLRWLGRYDVAMACAGWPLVGFHTFFQEGWTPC